MYNYSPIKSIYIKNFRNIGEAVLSFEKSPIITLVGENEAGKTSVVKAFAVCALHASPRDQKDYIRDESKMFGVAIDLEDNTRVVRMKEATGVNMYKVLKNGQEVWSTNKITDGLPVEVSNVMGLIEEPETGEFLHIRTYEDKLMFVTTANSANYKVMYNSLKIEQLTKAIKLGSDEVNGLKNEINNNSASIETLSIQSNSIKIVDIDALLDVKNRLLKLTDQINKVEKVRKLIEKTEAIEDKLGALQLIDKFNLEEINEADIVRLNTVSKLINQKNNVTNFILAYKDIDNLSEIDVSIYNKVINLLNKTNELSIKTDMASRYSIIDGLNEISEATVKQLDRCNTLVKKQKELNEKNIYNEIYNCSEIEQDDINALTKLITLRSNISKVKDHPQQIEELNNKSNKITEKMIQLGVAVEECPKCGETIVFDIDKIKTA